MQPQLFGFFCYFRNMQQPINHLLVLLITVPLFFFVSRNTAVAKETITHAAVYRCMPCGQDCDNEDYTAAGQCKHCMMPLVEKSTIRFKTIQPGDLCAYIKAHPKVLLLDVRTKEEFEEKADPNFGTLKNAINLPIQEFGTGLSALNAYKQRDIIVYCSHSHRSPQASYILMQNGFKNVTNMAGGLSVLTDNSCKVHSK